MNNKFRNSITPFRFTFLESKRVVRRSTIKIKQAKIIALSKAADR